MYNNKFTLVEQKCDECGKTIAVYRDDQISNYDAADICTECFKKFKVNMRSLIEQLQNRHNGKIDIYAEY